MKKEYSPGPWTVDKTTGTGSLIVDANGDPVGHVNERAEDLPLRTGQPMRRANGLMCAAAPDLVEALLNIENDDGRIPQTIWDLRTAALTKAGVLAQNAKA